MESVANLGETCGEIMRSIMKQLGNLENIKLMESL